MTKQHEDHIEDYGSKIGQVEVTIGPQFLNHFSENLYSSPNKAFEELVSNSWDAGATSVNIHVDKDLTDESTIVWVLDNGVSMDLSGLQGLWSVAQSSKRDRPPVKGRRPIGKFGVGKLATYILANKLTYVCKAADGVVRTVTMDYSRIDEIGGQGEKPQLFTSGLPLDVKELNETDLQSLLDDIPSGAKIKELLDKGIPKPPAPTDWEDEYGGEDPPANDSPKTWTLALLTSLKPAGKKMKVGWIRRMLRAALPLGSSISIVFNSESLESSKIDIPVEREWVIGKGLGINSVTLTDKSGNEVTRKIIEFESPYPHVQIEGTEGKITGKVRLFKARISGGKSDDIESSNGFFINILGRVINPQEAYFGLKNLNHSAWAKFRATVRNDALDSKLAVTREDLKENLDLDFFKAFLLSLFNKARNEHDSIKRAAWPDVAEVLTDRWGLVPLEPLRQVLTGGLGSETGLPQFIDTSNVTDASSLIEGLESDEEQFSASLIKEVSFANLLPTEPLVKYDLGNRKVVINKDHPFTVEHGETHEEQMVLRDTAVVDLLTHTYMLSIGVDSEILRQILEYKDQVFRLLAQVNRRTGPQIAALLEAATDHAKGLERIVGDALEYLGFVVQRLAQPGQPEGVAIAPLTPTSNSKDGTDDDYIAVNYKFTYDAKSSGKGKAQTGNLNIAGLARHRKDYEADHTLVVAPDYQVATALIEECEVNGITPMRARDLAKLLKTAMTVGPLDLNEFRFVFGFKHPDTVTAWVNAFCAKAESLPRLPLDLFLSALADIGYRGVNPIHISVIADRIGRLSSGGKQPRLADVKSIVSGLQVLVPQLIRIGHDNNVFLSTSPLKLREAIHKQLKAIPDGLHYTPVSKQIEKEGQTKTIYE